MVIASLLELNMKQLIKKVEKIINISLPRKVIEASLIPEERILYIRFEEPNEGEEGEPIHPLIHLFRDRRTGRITAIEIIDLDKLLKIVDVSSCQNFEH
jgi:hypothetical protein